MRHRKRLFRIGHIQRTAKPFASNFPGQSSQIYQAAARDIYDHRPLWQQRQSFAIKETASVLRQCCSQNQKLGPPQERLEFTEKNWIVLPQSTRCEWIVDDPAKVEATKQIHQGAPHAAKADHGDFAIRDEFCRTVE